jgi:tRNA(adenine34) deaminase
MMRASGRRTNPPSTLSRHTIRSTADEVEFPEGFGLTQTRSADDFMLLALREARQAAEAGEVPVGAVVVEDATQRVIARAHNQRELLRDPTAHAEILAITQAAAHYDSWRLSEVTLYVTLEPCLMCAGAIIQARVPRVVYGADDPKGGAHRTLHAVLVHPGNNHRPVVVAGVRALECGEILSEFFRRKRAGKLREQGGSGEYAE